MYMCTCVCACVCVVLCVYAFLPAAHLVCVFVCSCVCVINFCVQPGNLMVLDDKTKGDLAILDFGLMAEIDKKDMEVCVCVRVHVCVRVSRVDVLVVAVATWKLITLCTCARV